ncbi:MAG: Rieske 2Fe-2S domain-containing protein [Actinomycetota bacterium]|jgi:phenylpropionate dioxygenase-like ring-hydroxylating dioxygenase large terminal subunit
MIKNQWYAVEFGHEVGAKPKQARLFGQDLVLYRDSKGDVVCHSDICIHRGASLAGGKVVGDCVECPYHGWQFDADGACTRIPANRAGVPIPKKARVDNYPCVERYGFIFVFLGDLPENERPPIPVLPVMEVAKEARAAGNRVVQGEFHWNANYERVIENGADASHAPFVHSTSFGNPNKPEIEDFELVEQSVDGQLTGVTYVVNLEPPDPKGIWKALRRGKERPPVATGNGVFFPNLTFLQVNLPIGVMTLFTAVVPVDENHSISKWVMLRTFFTQPWAITLLRADKDSYKRTMKIFYEDRATVEGQRPELVPFDLSAELQVKSDSVQLAYRRWRQANIDKGWLIDEHVVGSRRYEGAKVVPSPARRANPELANAWVLKELEAREALREQRESERA